MTIKEILDQGKKELKEAGIQEADLDAWLLLESVTGISRAMYYVRQSEELPETQEMQYLEAVARRKKRIPLQHITGEQEFMGLTFQVNHSVLVPRQDTEILVEEALNLLKKTEKPRILDMCTGSGCILLSILK